MTYDNELKKLDVLLGTIQALISESDPLIRQNKDSPIPMQELSEKVTLFYNQLGALPNDLSLAYVAPMREVAITLNEWIKRLEEQKNTVKHELHSLSRYSHAIRAYSKRLT